MKQKTQQKYQQKYQQKQIWNIGDQNINDLRLIKDIKQMNFKITNTK